MSDATPTPTTESDTDTDTDTDTDSKTASESEAETQTQLGPSTDGADGETDEATDAGTQSPTGGRADAFEMIEDAATLAYAVYRGVDFEAIEATGRSFDDEFVGYLEDAASIRETLTEFHQELADACEVRAVDAMDGDVREIVRKYDAQDGRVASRRFLRTVRRNPAHVRLEMEHRFIDDDGGAGR